METLLIKRMEAMEKKIEALAQQRELERNEMRNWYNLDEIESPDEKRYREILKEASE